MNPMKPKSGVKSQVSGVADTHCIFCKIARKEIPSQLIRESDNWIAFKDIKPSAPVHILVVTKEHIESIKHLLPNHATVVAELIFAAKEVAASLGLKGYKLVFNVGPEGGQIIPHLHLHLLGGWTNKGQADNIIPLQHGSNNQ